MLLKKNILGGKVAKLTLLKVIKGK